jgi:YbbR domain-containing protein
VPGSHVTEDSRTAAVVVENLPRGYRLVSVEPAEVKVLLTGPRRRLPEGPETFKVRIDADLVELGRRTFRVSPAQVEAPPGVMALGIEPQIVKLSVERVDTIGPPSP